MAGYFDQYGAGEERRLRIIKILAVSVMALLLATGLSLFFFHNYRQEQQVKRFHLSFLKIEISSRFIQLK